MVEKVPFNPWMDRVLLKRDTFQKSTGGILIPEEAQRRHSQARGKIVAVGPQCSDPCKKAVGKTVLFGVHAGAWLDSNGVESEEGSDFFVCGEEDILGDVSE